MQGIEAVAALTGTQPGLLPTDTQAGAQNVAAPDVFANLLTNKLTEVNANVQAAESTLANLAAGKAVEPQEAMITMERARISVLTFVQLRNRLIESYQDLMRMQL